ATDAPELALPSHGRRASRARPGTGRRRSRTGLWETSCFPRLVELNAISLHKRFVEIVDVMKIRACVLVGAAHQSAFDEVEHDLAEIVGLLEAPHVKDGASHEPELAQGELADALEQLRP